MHRETQKAENDARKVEIEKSAKAMEALLNAGTDYIPTVCVVVFKLSKNIMSQVVSIYSHNDIVTRLAEVELTDLTETCFLKDRTSVVHVNIEMSMWHFVFYLSWLYQ